MDGDFSSARLAPGWADRPVGPWVRTTYAPTSTTIHCIMVYYNHSAEKGFGNI